MTQTLHSYDPQELSTYLEQNVAGFSGLAEIAKFSDGQSNPTYQLTDTAGRRFVLRAKPPGTLLKSAHAVDREFRVMTALAASAVPVPQMLHLSGQASPMGAQFLVMEHLNGRVFWDPALPEQLPKVSPRRVSRPRAGPWPLCTMLIPTPLGWRTLANPAIIFRGKCPAGQGNIAPVKRRHVPIWIGASTG
jgi:aminoglycoside phosphotransferase (APT) family kinase protein